MSKDFDSSSERVSKEGPRVNEQITNPTVRLILADGENIGIVSIKEALRHASEAQLDLIEISSAGEVPVCKLLDYGKYKYEQQKRKNEAKKKQKIVEIKEIKLTPNIGENDYQVKMRSVNRFLSEGNKVKFNLRFRGREMSYINLGMAVLERVKTDLADKIKVEQEPKLEGRQLSLLVAPVK